MDIYNDEMTRAPIGLSREPGQGGPKRAQKCLNQPKSRKIVFFSLKKRISTPKQANVVQISCLEIYLGFGVSVPPRAPPKSLKKQAREPKNYIFGYFSVFSFKMQYVSAYFDGKLNNGVTLAYRDLGVVLEGLQRGPRGHPESLKNTIWPKTIMFWDIHSRFFFPGALGILTKTK